MRKIIPILLAVIIAAASSVGAFAYLDISDSNVNNAVQELSSFDIINGYDDGTFRPDTSITRAEFSKIIIKACGYDNNGYSKISSFNDVADSNWAKDYIYIAKSLGIVNGINDTAFSPDSGITYEQAIKMIVAALGYEEDAQNRGGYPNGYINVADSLGITSGVFFSNTDKATRGDIALMIYNSLNVEYYDIWNNNGVVEKKLSDITLYEKHELIQEIKESGGISSGATDGTEEAVG